MAGNHVKAPALSAQPTDTVSPPLDPLFLIAPALWSGYLLLQWDPGGYLARCYEGYLVPSRSAVFGLYLHVKEGPDPDLRRDLGPA
jgi:hypothetical protein